MSSDSLTAPKAASETAPEKPASARDRILSVAGPLFYREGYRAIGIDRVIAEADVAKATFYKHFPSKDDLIVAWIARAEAFSAKGLPPEDGPEPLTAYVDAMLAIARQGACMGCTYQGSAAEFHDPAHPAHAAAMGVKIRVLETLETRARAQGLTDPRATAEAVFLFLEGVWASVRMFGSKAPLAHTETAARRLFV
ncbi:MAG: TetR/AcrR family transcriptional regulator [Tabrizicola sp.]